MPFFVEKYVLGFDVSMDYRRVLAVAILNGEHHLKDILRVGLRVSTSE